MFLLFIFARVSWFHALYLKGLSNVDFFHYPTLKLKSCISLFQLFFIIVIGSSSSSVYSHSHRCINLIVHAFPLCSPQTSSMGAQKQNIKEFFVHPT